jgi:hypothetical protein
MILFSRGIGPIPVAVVLREKHQSTLGVTEIPIETGAKITDHAYIEPKRLSLEFADQFAAATWAALVRFQESRQPFVAVSGLSVYPNMLVKELHAERDRLTSRILKGEAVLQEVILVSTARVPGGEGGAEGASKVSAEKAGDATTADRASGTVTRGDQANAVTTPTVNRSVLNRVFNGGGQ